MKTATVTFQIQYDSNFRVDEVAKEIEDVVNNSCIDSEVTIIGEVSVRDDTI